MHFKKVGSFKFLGYLTIFKDEIKEEIKARIAVGNFAALIKQVKIKLYKTMTKPIVMYGINT